MRSVRGNRRPIRITGLLFYLVGLLADLLTDLLLVAVPVVEEHGAAILEDLELSANDRKTSFDEAIAVRRPLVLLVPSSGEIVEWRESISLQDAGVLLHDGYVRLKLGQSTVAELICLGEVWVCDGVRALEVWVEGCDDALIGVGSEVQCAGANLGVLECLDGVMDDRIRLEMLLEH
jgi:hypothetical protein